MKPFKKIALLFSALLFLGIYASQAQTRRVITPTVPQGNYIDFGGTLNGSVVTPVDSLQVSDSIAYTIPFVHTNKQSAYYIWYWNKIGSGTATITLSFLQGNDSLNLFPVLAGQAHSAYTKTYTLSANTWSEVDFDRDTAQINGRYLKVYFITSSTASVKGKLFNRLKTNYW